MRISIGNLIITGGIRLMKEYCQVLFIFFFSGRLCRNRCCTFLDFQNRFDKVCRIVFRFVHRPLADSFRRNLLQNGNASAFQDLKSGAHPYLPYDLAVCSCMDIIYIRFSVTYFLYSFHSAWSFLFSLERALPEKFHFFIEKIIRKSKEEQADIPFQWNVHHAEP